MRSVYGDNATLGNTTKSWGHGDKTRHNHITKKSAYTDNATMGISGKAWCVTDKARRNNVGKNSIFLPIIITILECSTGYNFYQDVVN